MRVLVVSAACPGPLAAGSALRTGGWLRAAATSASVGIVTLTRTADEQEQGVRELGAVCDFVRNVHAPRTGLRRGRDLVRALLGGEPYAITAAAERSLRREVEVAVATWRPDIVQAEGIGAAPYLAIGCAAGIPTVYSAAQRRIAHCSGRAGYSERFPPDRRGAHAPRRTTAGRSRHRRRRRVGGRGRVVPERRRRRALHPQCHRSRPLHLRSAEPAPRWRPRVPGSPRLPAERRRGNAAGPAHPAAYPPPPGDVRCIVAGRAPVRAVRDLAGDGVQVLAERRARIRGLAARRDSGVPAALGRQGAG